MIEVRVGLSQYVNKVESSVGRYQPLIGLFQLNPAFDHEPEPILIHELGP